MTGCVLESPLSKINVEFDGLGSMCKIFCPRRTDCILSFRIGIELSNWWLCQLKHLFTPKAKKVVTRQNEKHWRWLEGADIWFRYQGPPHTHVGANNQYFTIHGNMVREKGYKCSKEKSCIYSYYWGGNAYGTRRPKVWILGQKQKIMW